MSRSTTVLVLLAAVPVTFGILKPARGDMLIGILLIVVAGLLVGPGGVSVFS